MAGETTYADLVSNGGRVSEVMTDLIHENLYDRSSLRGLMTLIPYGSLGSAATSVSKVTQGLALTAATSETDGSNVGNTALSTDKYTLTVARYKAARELTDLFDITGGSVNVNYTVTRLAEALDLTFTNLLAALFPSVSGTVGTTGTTLTVDDIYDAKFALNIANNAGKLAFVGHGKQLNEFEESLRGESGVVERLPASQGVVTAMNGQGLKFSWGGIDFYQSDSIGNAGGDHIGCMFSGGAFSHQVAPTTLLDPMQINQQDIVLQTPDLFIERVRDGGNGSTQFVINAWPAVAEAEDARATRVISVV